MLPPVLKVNFLNFIIPAPEKSIWKKLNILLFSLKLLTKSE